MSQIERCKRCILPTSLPSVKLDEHGICNPCREYEHSMAKWISTKEKMCKKWEAIVAAAKKKNRRYDCLIPLSGGKDSVYALYVCAKMSGLKCLCITFDNGYMTQHATDNIRRSIDACDADHMTFRLSRPTQLLLYRIYLSRCGSFCAACMRGIFESIEIASRTFKIPLIVFGGGWRVTYLSMLTEIFQGGDQWVFSRVADQQPIIKEAHRLGAVSRFARMPQLFFRIERKLRHWRGPKEVNIYDYMDTDRNDVLKIITKEIGWKQMSSHFEHTDCGLHPVVGHIHGLRFPALSPETAHHAGQVRFGELTREEAIKLEEELLANQSIPEELEGFLKEIGISQEEFERYASDWRSVEHFR